MKKTKEVKLTFLIDFPKEWSKEKIIEALNARLFSTEGRKISLI